MCEMLCPGGGFEIRLCISCLTPSATSCLVSVKNSLNAISKMHIARDCLELRRPGYIVVGFTVKE